MQFQQSQKLKTLLETKACCLVCGQSQEQDYDLLTAMIEITRIQFFGCAVQDTDESSESKL